MTQAIDHRGVLERLGAEETTTDQTSTDVYKSMIRRDRLAVAKWFKAPIEDLMEDHEIDGITALAFVHMIREGKGDRDAFNAVENLTNEELWVYFAPDDDDDQAETPGGKGGPPVTSSPTISPTTELVSVSPTASPPVSTTD